MATVKPRHNEPRHNERRTKPRTFAVGSGWKFYIQVPAHPLILGAGYVYQEVNF